MIYQDTSSYGDHESLTPPNAAEQFFLPSLSNDSISAFALAAAVRNKVVSVSSRNSVSNVSLATDFVTCEDQSTNLSDAGPLPVSSFCIEEGDETNDDEDEEDDSITVRRSKRSHSSPARDQPREIFIATSVFPDVSPRPAQITPSSSPVNCQANEFGDNKVEKHYDVGQHAYQEVKKFWAFGKTFPVVKFFLQTTENVASQVLSIKGLNLADVDQGLSPILSGWDKDFLNPTIQKVLNAVIPALQQAQEKFKPIIIEYVPRFVKPLGLMKEDSLVLRNEKLVVIKEEKEAATDFTPDSRPVQ